MRSVVEQTLIQGGMSDVYLANTLAVKTIAAREALEGVAAALKTIACANEDWSTIRSKLVVSHVNIVKVVRSRFLIQSFSLLRRVFPSPIRWST